MISHNNKKRTWHRAAALLLSASLLLTACGAQNNNDNIFSPILPDNSPASSTDPDDKLPDPVTIVVEDDSVAPAEGMVRSRLTNEWVDADVAATRPIAVMIPNEAAAIPQYSLSEASILYEANVENRMTRMMAVYEGWEDLDKIGNIRVCVIIMPTGHLNGMRSWCISEAFFINELLEQPDTQDIDGTSGTDEGAFFRTTDRNKPTMLMLPGLVCCG
ncbi:MAG: DUF3048 domain-containing protein [Waltera sp.]